MDSISLKALFIQVALLLLSCFNVLAYNDVTGIPAHYGETLSPDQSPSLSPTYPAQPPPYVSPTYPPPDETVIPPQPPSPSPTYPPAPAPAPVFPPPRKPRPLQGLVYCEACPYNGPGNIRGRTPLSGAIWNTKCSDPAIRIASATTDGEGYFKIKGSSPVLPPGCSMSLRLSSAAKCNIPVTFNHPYRMYFMMVPGSANFTRNLSCPN